MHGIRPACRALAAVVCLAWLALAASCAARLELGPPRAGRSGLPSATVTAAQLNLRHSPSAQAAILEVLPQGAVVEVVSRQGGWVEVRSPARILGWVDASYLAGAPSASPSPPSSTPQEIDLAR